MTPSCWRSSTFQRWRSDLKVALARSAPERCQWNQRITGTAADYCDTHDRRVYTLHWITLRRG